MESSKASSKGQMVIPKKVREALGIRSGTHLGIELLEGKAFKVTVEPSSRAAQVRRLAGSLAHRAKRVTPGEEEASILKSIRADDERTRTRGRRRR
jgi:AbrB family looped-hinge helix DNA binding protein